MTVNIYYDLACPDLIYAYFPDDGEAYAFKSMARLKHDCHIDYGDNFELVEITDQNYQQLLKQGVFDFPIDSYK